MTLIRITAAVFILAMPTSSFAQEWIEYVDRTERFCVNFPGQPMVKDITYQPQNGKPVPARVYSVQDGARRYSVTVVNYAGRGNVRGATAWEAWNFRKRGGEVTYDAFSNVDRIEGHQLHITNKDKSQTVAGIYLHDRRLYVLEATVPPNSPGAVHFQQSLYMLDAEGKRVRYELDAEGNRTGRVQYPDRACS